MNIQRFPRSIFLVCCLLLLPTLCCLAITTKGIEEASKIIRRDVYRSPDGSLLATIIFLKQRHRYGDPPSRVEIRRADGQLLSGRDYSNCGGQGYTVRKAGWTTDGRCFVYIVDSSGGHGPWRHPIFFYHRKRNRFYSMGGALETLGNGSGTITGDLELRPRCLVVTKGRYYSKSRKGLRASVEPGDQSGEQRLEIDLRWLKAHLGISAEDDDGQKILTPNKKRSRRP